MNDGLKAGHRRTVLEILQAHPGVEKAVLFGSRAMGTFTAESDVDICLFGKSLTTTDQARLAAKIEDLPMPQRVDLLLHHAIKDKALLEHIRREGKVLFQKSGGRAGEWREVALSELADLSGGFAFKSEDYAPAGRFVLRTLNIRDDCSISHDDAVYLPEDLVPQYGRFELQPDDTLFVMVGATLGKVGFVRERDLPALLNQNIWLIRAKKGVADPRFVHYAFRNAVKASLGWASGSARDFVRRDDYRNLQISVPDLEKQRVIANVLGTLDDKIELNRRMSETLEAMARALFKSWFVDFDPVRAKADGRNPWLPEHIADLFPDSFMDSELGKIPKGWEVEKIENVAERVGMGPFGSSIRVETFVVEGVPVISGQHLRGFMMDDSKFNFVSPDHAERLKSANVTRGDVVFTHAGNIGQVAYIPENSRFERYVLSQRQFFIRCDRARVSPRFITLYFRSPEGQDKLLANASSSGVPSIAQPVTYLRSIQLTIPPKPVMYAFDQLIQPMLLLFRYKQNESRTIANLRDALLPKLISGELRVKDAERFIGEVGT